MVKWLNSRFLNNLKQVLVYHGIRVSSPNFEQFFHFTSSLNFVISGTSIHHEYCFKILEYEMI